MIQAAGNNSIRMMHDLCNKVYEDNAQKTGDSDQIIVPQHKENDKQEWRNYRDKLIKHTQKSI